LEIGVPFDITESFVTGNKIGCTWDFEQNFFAKIGKNTFVPVKIFTESEKSFVGYTRNFLKNPTTTQKQKNYNKISVRVSQPIDKHLESLPDKTDIIATKKFFCGGKEREEDFLILKDDNSKNFTIHFLMDIQNVIDSAPKSV
jgi:hypothetical protein